MVRKVLNTILRGQTLDDESLSTQFYEVESIVNGRPLTVLSDDPNDETPLTPNHLLLLHGGPYLVPGRFDHSDIYGRRWRRSVSLQPVLEMLGWGVFTHLAAVSKVVMAKEKFAEW